MIKKIWSCRSWLSLFLTPLSILYGILVKLRRLCYKLEIFPSWKAPVPIIVVGNLTVGGNGKTPVVIWLVEELASQGYRVGVVSRGYGAQATSYPVLVDQNIPITGSGDEPALIYRRTGVPVAVAPKRVAAVKMLLQQQEFDVIITDDGLQHYALKRDFEIVVIDGDCRFGNCRLLPAGPLRECQYRLNSVNAIILNAGRTKHGEVAMQLTGDIAINMLTGEKKFIFELKKVVAIAGIGRPSRFFSSLEQKGVALLATHAFSDHQCYELYTLTALVNQDQTLLMTEKDAVKCFHFAQLNWWYLPVDARLSKPGAEKILAAIIELIELSKKTKSRLIR
ncbi:MAG: tetraacyldisaccharide 4'-kinase [Candidatus Arsenophonus melophagi]|nr:tetraacyldisaccharide 4'-kinase [Candidatus Arsenophonus melophagi]